jgi:hypothetical protein
MTFFGWLFGCRISDSPFLTPGKVSKSKLFSAYGIILSLAHPIMVLYVLLNIKSRPDGTISEYIAAHVMYGVLNITESVRRLWYFWYRSSISQIFKEVCFDALEMAAVKSNSRSKKEFCIICAYLVMVATCFICYVSAMAHFAERVVSYSSAVFDLAVALFMFWSASRAFSAYVVIMIGSTLIDRYEDHVMQFVESTTISTNSRSEFVRTFEQLKQLVVLYDKGIGFLILMAIVENTVLLGSCITYLFAAPAAITFRPLLLVLILESIEAIMNVFLTARIGQRWVDSVSRYLSEGKVGSNYYFV